jgi:hypothetical protein
MRLALLRLWTPTAITLSKHLESVLWGGWQKTESFAVAQIP